MTTLIEFGSHHHGCHDTFSDRDIFILYDKSENISHEKYQLEKSGYSVTSAIRSRTEYLSKIGSLFSRHVFFEGKVISGSEQEVSNIRNLWSPASDYNHEIEDNIQLLSVLESVPSTKESLATVNDILICSLRNVLIRKLANKGLYLFSWKDVLDESVKQNMLNTTDVKIMYQARRYKNAYRLELLPAISNSFIALLEGISRKVIDSRRLVKRGGHKQIISSPENQIEGSYSQLRAIELLTSHYYFHYSMKKHLMLAKDPSYFCAVGPNKALQRTSH